MTSRMEQVTRKVETPFGSMYLHLDLDGRGRACGGAISDPQKERDSQVARLIQSLSEALDDGLRSVALREGE